MEVYSFNCLKTQNPRIEDLVKTKARTITQVSLTQDRLLRRKTAKGNGTATEPDPNKVGFRSWPCFLLDMWPWAAHSNCLTSGRLLYKMKMFLTLRVVVRTGSSSCSNMLCSWCVSTYLGLAPYTAVFSKVRPAKHVCWEMFSVEGLFVRYVRDHAHVISLFEINILRAPPDFTLSEGREHTCPALYCLPRA